jgi:gluconate 2-dehydrogenase subunit 3-like protein
VSEANPSNDFPRLNRRDAIRWMLAASASVALSRAPIFGQTNAKDAGQGGKPNLPETPAAPTHQIATGYGTDPDLTKTYQPGDFWKLTFTDLQRRNAAMLCAMIIPADQDSPSAAKVGVPDFIDEWISAPYPDQQKDRAIILPGLDWIETESQTRYTKSFADLDETQAAAICDEICYKEKASLKYAKAAEFFTIFRNLTAGGFYTTPEGMKDLKYIGNIPLASFEGPPLEALRQVGLA